MTWIQTYDGQAFDVAAPDPDLINPQTIAVVLSRLCRFGGHCKRFYSVAQHSLLVESLIDIPELKLPALLHDAHEIYIGDIVRPVKLLVPDFNTIADRIDCAVAKRFGFHPQLFLDDMIKHADDTVLATEARDLMMPPLKLCEEFPPPLVRTEIEPWSIEKSAGLFWDRLNELIS